jgi:ABC-type Fe3+-hydroxamate transport system substrate-binding protein
LYSTVLLLAFVLGSGCEPTEDPAGSTTVTDDLGRSVRLQRPIDRVVSLAPNLTEIAYAAGGGSTLVAVTTADDYPPAVDTLDRVSALPLDFEAVTAQQPDLVLATDQVNPPGDTETFAALDVPIYFFSFGSIEDVFDAIRTTGTLLGTEAVAADTVAALKREMSALAARTDALAPSERPRVLVLIGDDTLYSFGEGSYIHRLVATAGGRSITDTLGTEAPTLSEEFVLAEQPDVIVGTWGPDYDPARLLELHPTWDVVPALKNDRVYSLPPSLLLRPGPRLVEGAGRLARLLHPGLFPDADPTSATARRSVDVPRRPSLAAPPSTP